MLNTTNCRHNQLQTAECLHSFRPTVSYLSLCFVQSVLLFWIDRQPIISCGVRQVIRGRACLCRDKQIGTEHVQLGHSFIIACVKWRRNDGSTAVETSPLTKLMSMITTWSWYLIIYQSVTWLSLSSRMYVDKSCRYRPYGCNFLRCATGTWTTIGTCSQNARLCSM